MNHSHDRAILWQELQDGPEPWDLVVVGGGITGAGVLLEAARRGLRALLLEQRDFAWGTSSRSSKMIHGGLRYISQGDIKLTRDAVQERELLLTELPGLIERMGYVYPVRKGQFPGRTAFTTALIVYDRFAGQSHHCWLGAEEVAERFPGIKMEALKGGCYYTDAVCDDARLVYRILQEARARGGVAINYVQALDLLLADGRVGGVVARDEVSGEQAELRARATVSATGAWADVLRSRVHPERRIRPLRGSHLIFSAEKLPARDCMTILHPRDKRPVFVFPWEGRTVVGTTDLDHEGPLDEEARISQEETDYLFEVLAHQYGRSPVGPHDVISTYSGIRPVIGSERHKDPSKERRDHAVWSDGGLITVSGGKLTTFRLIALDALKAAAEWIGKEGAAPQKADYGRVSGIFSAPETEDPHRELAGRLGSLYGEFRQSMPEAEQAPLEGTRYSLAECRWAARREMVVHLDDLLLRRTRLGLLLPRGGETIWKQIETIALEELGWDGARWSEELARYQDIWRRYYAPPG